MCKRLGGEQGTALLETAMTLPLLLLVSVGIFEFGRAYQTWQVLTNAAREGARIAVMPSPVPGAVDARVRSYLTSGQLDRPRLPMPPSSSTGRRSPSAAARRRRRRSSRSPIRSSSWCSSRSRVCSWPDRRSGADHADGTGEMRNESQ